ncbi:MAG: nuclear transport factor 2 family protein [Bacteroidetes bacterium]|nr:nuclear transport factor 2 family protein [Bacteroidota bacterium]
MPLKSIICSVIVSCFFLFHSSSSFAQSKDEMQIRKILTQQNNAWNQGNLDSFMVGYWNSDSLLFIGSGGPRYGYATTLIGYKKSYPDTAHMGHFTSTILSMKKLSGEYYFVVGKWELARSVGDVSGYYTLLFRKIKGVWVIVADHSS